MNTVLFVMENSDQHYTLSTQVETVPNNPVLCLPDEESPADVVEVFVFEAPIKGHMLFWDVVCPECGMLHGAHGAEGRKVFGCPDCKTCITGICTPDCGNGVCQSGSPCFEDCSTCPGDCPCTGCT